MANGDLFGQGGLAGRTTVQPSQMPSGTFGMPQPPVAPPPTQVDPIDSEIDRVMEQVNREVDEDLVRRQIGPPSAPWYKTAGRFALELGGQLLATRLPGGALIKGALGGLGAAGGSLAAETFDPTKAPLTTAYKTGIFGVGGELAGRGLGAGVSRLGGGAKKALPEAQEAIEVLAKYGATPTAGQVTKNRAIDLAETIAETSLFGGGRITATKEKSVDVVEGLLDNYVRQFQVSGLSRGDIGKAVQSAIGQEKSIFKAAENGLYKKVDTLTGGAAVDFIDTKKTAAGILDSMEQRGHSSPVKSVLNAIMAQPDFVTFSMAKEFRSDLLAISRSTTDILPGKTIGASKHVAGEIDSAMESSASKLKGDAVGAWRDANAFTAAGKEKFNNSFIKKMVKSDPDALLDAALKTRRPGQIKQIKDMVKDPDDWKAVQGEFLSDVMTKSVGPEGSILGNKLTKAMGQYGPGVLREMFEADQVSELQKLARVLSVTQTKTHPQGQLAAFRFAQGGAALTLFTGTYLYTGDPGTAAKMSTVLIAPAILARGLTNPSFVKLVTKGLTLPPGTPEAARTVAQILALVPAQSVGDREMSREELRSENARLTRLAKEQREKADRSVDEAMEALKLSGRIPQ